MSETTPVEPLDPTATARVADRSDRYDRLLALADSFDAAGGELRARSALGLKVLRDPAVAESADLSAPTYTRAEEDIRAATTGKNGLLSRSIDLDADALVVRATVLTYQWIDELREAAYETLGSIAGRAIGYLAPNVALGGAIVSAGLIETDALDRDGVAAYLSELAAANPELMDHVTAGGGGLLDSLQMRALLTAGVVSGDPGRQAARGGLKALGVSTMRHDSSAAVRDVAGGLLTTGRPATEVASPDSTELPQPGSVTDLMLVLQDLDGPLVVQRTAPSRYIAYVGSPPDPDDQADDLGLEEPGRAGPRLLAGDLKAHAAAISRGISAATDGDDHAHVLAVGAGAGGAVAAQLAAATQPNSYVIDSVVTAGAPAAHVPRLPGDVRMLALEDRADPVALLGSLVTAGETNRTTVVFDAAGTSAEGVYVAGGRAADTADDPDRHPDLFTAIQRLRDLGYLRPIGA